jgi:glycosyltransferase involved in cell wall biosynthesis
MTGRPELTLDTLTMSTPHVLILGIRGLPARHGGFETFAEKLALYLVERGWRVTVYCQGDTPTSRVTITTDKWRGIDRVEISVPRSGAAATIEFDWHSIRHAARQDGVCLVLGYNTAAFLPVLRMAGRPVLINMDGLEWKRPKWSRPVQAWFYLNEWLGARLGSRIIADHPVIAERMIKRGGRKDVTMIPYGGDEVLSVTAAPLEPFGLVPDKYLVSIARIEPDNNILPIVQAFSRRKRNARLVVLGTFDRANAYHRAVKASASSEVSFPGAIYEKLTVQALRFHARAYCHGHIVGGTNPSLVESLWCGNAVLAHRNPFNMWTAGAEQFYFEGTADCDRAIEQILSDDEAVARARSAARMRAAANFQWGGILTAYERELAAVGGYTCERTGQLPVSTAIGNAG